MKKLLHEHGYTCWYKTIEEERFLMAVPKLTGSLRELEGITDGMSSCCATFDFLSVVIEILLTEYTGLIAVSTSQSGSKEVQKDVAVKKGRD